MDKNRRVCLLKKILLPLKLQQIGLKCLFVLLLLFSLLKEWDQIRSKNAPGNFTLSGFSHIRIYSKIFVCSRLRQSAQWPLRLFLKICKLVNRHESKALYVCLRNFTKFKGKHLCQSLFFHKVAGLRPSTLWKKKLWDRCVPVNVAKSLRKLFYLSRCQIFSWTPHWNCFWC